MFFSCCQARATCAHLLLRLLNCMQSCLASDLGPFSLPASQAHTTLATTCCRGTHILSTSSNRYTPTFVQSPNSAHSDDDLTAHSAATNPWGDNLQLRNFQPQHHEIQTP